MSIKGKGGGKKEVPRSGDGVGSYFPPLPATTCSATLVKGKKGEGGRDHLLSLLASGGRRKGDGITIIDLARAGALLGHDSAL